MYDALQISKRSGSSSATASAIVRNFFSFFYTISRTNLIIVRKKAPGDKDINAGAKDICHYYQ